MKIYPGAWHGLDPATRADAWQRSLDFLRRYLGRVIAVSALKKTLT